MPYFRGMKKILSTTLILLSLFAESPGQMVTWKPDKYLKQSFMIDRIQHSRYEGRVDLFFRGHLIGNFDLECIEEHN